MKVPIYDTISIQKEQKINRWSKIRRINEGALLLIKFTDCWVDNEAVKQILIAQHAVESVLKVVIHQEIPGRRIQLVNGKCITISEENYQKALYELDESLVSEDYKEMVANSGLDKN